jgi:hypothetical protein
MDQSWNIVFYQLIPNETAKEGSFGVSVEVISSDGIAKPQSDAGRIQFQGCLWDCKLALMITLGSLSTIEISAQF